MPQAHMGAERTTITFEHEVFVGIQKERAKVLAEGVEVGFNDMVNRLLRKGLRLPAKKDGA